MFSCKPFCWQIKEQSLRNSNTGNEDNWQIMRKSERCKDKNEIFLFKQHSQIFTEEIAIGMCLANIKNVINFTRKHGHWRNFLNKVADLGLHSKKGCYCCYLPIRFAKFFILATLWNTLNGCLCQWIIMLGTHNN